MFSRSAHSLRQTTRRHLLSSPLISFPKPPLIRLAHIPSTLASSTSSSTPDGKTYTPIPPVFHGQMGNKYTRGDLLYCNLADMDKSIYKVTSSSDRTYTAKPGNDHTYVWNVVPKFDIPGAKFIRMPVDVDAKQQIIVLPYMRGNLKEFVDMLREEATRNDGGEGREQKQKLTIKLAERKKILRGLMRGVKEMHDAGWAHLDLEPRNVYLDWTVSETGEIEIQNVLLGGLGNNVKISVLNGLLLTLDVEDRWGTLAWRAPEVHISRGMGPASDVFSLGLLTYYLLSHDSLEFSLEQLPPIGPPHRTYFGVLITMFGPVRDNGFYDHFLDENYAELARQFDEVGKDCRDGVPGVEKPEGLETEENDPEMKIYIDGEVVEPREGYTFEDEYRERYVEVLKRSEGFSGEGKEVEKERDREMADALRFMKKMWVLDPKKREKVGGLLEDEWWGREVVEFVDGGEMNAGVERVEWNWAISHIEINVQTTEKEGDRDWK